MKRLAATIVGFICLPLLAGCGSGESTAPKKTVYKAAGKLTYEDGTPVAHLQVVLNPVKADDPTARGETDDNGKFRLGTYSADDGAAAGDYKVTVQPSAPTDPSKMPVGGAPIVPKNPEYASVASTPLKVTIKADGDNTNLDLKMKGSGK